MLVPVPGKVQYREEDVSGFLFTESGYPPHTGRPWHVHDLAEFCFMLEGGFTETCHRRHLTCRESDVSFKPAGEGHEVKVGGRGAHFVTVQVPVTRYQRDELLASALREPQFFPGSPLAVLGSRIRSELVRPDPMSPLVLESTALELMALAGRHARPAAARPAPPWLDRVLELLHDSFASPPPLRRIAAVADVHPAHLSEVFRRQHGCTIGEYVRRLRIRHACTLLAESRRPLAEIALAAGFADQSHFTRQFRQHLGMTPARYRRLRPPA